MSRYIDADKLYERLQDISAYYEEGREVKEEAVEIVYDFPTADVEEVTRCFECKYSHISEKDMILRCRLNGDRSTDPYGYCDRGKEKEE